MRANFLVILAAAMIVFISATSGVFASDSHENAINSHENHGKKYVVDKVGEKDLESLREKGCEIVKQHRKVASVSCPDDVALALNLKEDIKVYAVDINADKQIGADSAWASGYTGAGRKVAVLDTGIDYTHQELNDSYGGGWNVIVNNSNPFDDNGHGTHVAGIITSNGAFSGRSKGVAPDAQVLAFKVLDKTGSGYFSDVIAAMYDAVDGQDGVYGTFDDYNADVISMSLGSSAPYLYTGSDCDSAYPEMKNATAYANSRGVAVVVAAGNDARGVSIPGCISGVITVGAVDSNNLRASFSGVGGSLDVMAPGVGIYSTIPGNSYASWSGTSMATPHVSAAIALMKQANSSISVSEISNALYSTATDLGASGWDKYYGFGLINVPAAISYAISPPSQPKMHIASISISKQTLGSKTRAVVTVNVVNATGSAVSGASVSGHWSGLTSGTSIATTSSSGTAIFYSAWKTKANGIFTFTVDNMAKSGWIYDYSANAASSASIRVP